MCTAEASVRLPFSCSLGVALITRARRGLDALGFVIHLGISIILLPSRINRIPRWVWQPPPFCGRPTAASLEMWLAINLMHYVQAVSSEHDPTHPLWRRLQPHGRHFRMYIYLSPLRVHLHPRGPMSCMPLTPTPPYAGIFVTLHKLLNTLSLLPKPQVKVSTHKFNRT